MELLTGSVESRFRPALENCLIFSSFSSPLNRSCTSEKARARWQQVVEGTPSAMRCRHLTMRCPRTCGSSASCRAHGSSAGWAGRCARWGPQAHAWRCPVVL